MNAEEELKLFKQQTLKKNRMASVVLGLAAVIAILFMMYLPNLSKQVDKGIWRFLPIRKLKRKFQFSKNNWPNANLKKVNDGSAYQNYFIQRF